MPCDAPFHVRALSAYQPGKPISELAREMGLDEKTIVKLASNENPLGMSPKAHEAACHAMGEAARYPDGNGFALKAALAQHLTLSPAQMVLGNGSNDVLELVARAFLEPGKKAVYARYAFAVYPLVTQAIGATGVEVPDVDFGHDLPAMAAAVDDDTRVVFIANPNNPTGTFLPGAAVQAFLKAVPSDVLVVLDEAYTEYLDEDARYDSTAWLADFPNLVICRTFSKAYGLAGLRVGYAVAHPAVADLMNRVRQPFNVSVVAQAAAEAALQDPAFIAETARLNREERTRLAAFFTQKGLFFIPSEGNFLAVRIPDAQKVNQALLREGVIVRPLAGYGMADFLRVSNGLPEENTRFMEALDRVVG
jgi:histidinol-phosphate aminotransferase